MILGQPKPPTSYCSTTDIKPLDNLNVEFNSLNSIVVFWNKYQICLYESYKMESAEKIFCPEFQIHQLLITTNYLICLDTNGHVHVISLKLKCPGQELIKCAYQPRDHDVKVLATLCPDLLISLKYDTNTYFLCLNRIDCNFVSVKCVALRSKELWPLLENSKEKCFLAHRRIDELHYELFQKMYKVEKLSDQHLIVLTFDRRTIYGCLFDPNMEEDETNLLKLYTCPSEICSIEIIGTENIYMLIALKIGTVILLSLNNLYQSSIGSTIIPELKHLNTAIYNLNITNDTLIYTDGVTMWKAETIFSENITFQQFFIKNIYDFAICEDQLICTTFNKLVYRLSLLDKYSYVKPVTNEYSPAETVLDNSKYIYAIYQEIERGKRLAERMSEEGCYLAAMSLSKRPEVMHDAIESSVTVSESFEDLIKTNCTKLTLTEDMSQYFGIDVYLFLITVTIKSNQGKVSEVINNILTCNNAELHITLSNNDKMLKTTTVKMSKTTYLIPLKLENSSEINVDISLIPLLPGSHDKKMKIWVDMYKKKTKLTSENFIRGNLQNSLIVQKPKVDVEKSILNFDNQYKSLIDYTNVSKLDNASYSMFIRLPEDIDHLGKYFSKMESEYMKQLMSTNEFLLSKSPISFKIGKETVTVSLENDGFSKPHLKVTSGNVKITSNLRNYFSNIVYGGNSCRPGEEYINHGFYTTVENLQKAMKECITTSASFEEFSPLMAQFEKDIIAMLPV